jgi:hypothetical protein
MLGALKKPLDAPALSELENQFPKDAFFGERYAKEQMAHLDSER